MVNLRRFLGFALLISSLLILSACGEQKLPQGCVDNDGDGYGLNCVLGLDCDDTNPATYPGALENYCSKNHDNNCDGTEDADTVVNFSDTNLKSAIQTTLSLSGDTILNSDLCQLVSLNAKEKGISDLTGLEYCINLKGIYLEKNQISNISVLAYLVNLVNIELSNNQINNISALANLFKIEFLSLMNNKITDLQALVNNTGIGSGDYIFVNGNPLDNNECDKIDILEGRGATVKHDLTCP